VGQGKSTYTFSAECLPLSAPTHLLALREAYIWWGGGEAESGISLPFGGKRIC